MRLSGISSIDFIKSHTEIISNPLIPELRLYMVTENCPMWRMDEADVERLGIEAPYWGFSWPGGHALARHIIDHPQIVKDKTVLDFGTGAGIVAIAASIAGAKRVIASDTDQLALDATQLNASLNKVKIETSLENFIGTYDPRWEIVLAADVCYEAQLTEEITKWLLQLHKQGIKVLFADPKRGWLQEHSVQEVAHYETPCDIDCRGNYLQNTYVYSWIS
jgi:predicted nicotinamide N-methyase